MVPHTQWFWESGKENSQVSNGVLGMTQLSCKVNHLSLFSYQLRPINTVPGRTECVCMETNQEDIWGSFGQNKFHGLEVHTIDSY